MRERTGGDAHPQPHACARDADLVAFLYGEADPATARDFQTHLHACAVCRDELAAFGEVRARVGEWRAEGLGEAPALSAAYAPAPPLVPVRARSARAAVREFFALAPLWLRAGACATLLFVCGMAALVLAHTRISWGADGLAFTAGVPERVVTSIERVEAPAPAAPDEARVEALVEERVRAALAARRTVEQETTGAQDAPVPRLEEAVNRPPRRRRATPRTTPRGPRRLEDEESLPRLSDLLSGVY